jgi:ribosome-binding protein aMBF1 (putative translation factor)
MSVKTPRAQVRSTPLRRTSKRADAPAQGHGLPNLDHDPEFAFMRLQFLALAQVAAAMEADDVSRSELARRLGCSRANISRLLNEKANFKMEMLAKLATALDRDIEIRFIRKNEEVVVKKSRPRSPKPKSTRPTRVRTTNR